VPTYEYVCQSCGTHVEVYQRFSDESLTECGVCGGPLRKVFHPAGILFKGSGFYVTDSRSRRSEGSDRKSGAKEKASGEGARERGSGDGAKAATAGEKTASSSGTGEPRAQSDSRSKKERSA
jgi:putative FmdB family regulatory protein